jgi:YHS domain-containing protein
MVVDESVSPYRADYRRASYAFCGAFCAREFARQPLKYLSATYRPSKLHLIGAFLADRVRSLSRELPQAARKPRLNPLRWWTPVASAVVACGFGFATYAWFDWVGKMPEDLREHPWPMELASVAATAMTIALAVRAWRRARARAVASLAAAVAVLSTGAFLYYVHVFSYRLPPPPRGLGIGTPAPDFTLPDEADHLVTLSQRRGHATLLVFYRGFW